MEFNRARNLGWTRPFDQDKTAMITPYGPHYITGYFPPWYHPAGDCNCNGGNGNGNGGGSYHWINEWAGRRTPENSFQTWTRTWPSPPDCGKKKVKGPYGVYNAPIKRCTLAAVKKV